ncbi:MAG: hypothetical protein WAV00_22680 [Nocardioides sp.]
MSATPLSATTRASAAVLTMNDRCDRCGAPAYRRVELSSGSELLFCGHHAREYDPELRKLAAAVYDQTGGPAP